MAKVLVVDDDDGIRMLVQIQLRENGHKVAVAASPDEALQLVRERGAPDIAVLDVSMPGMDGFDLMKLLREIEGMENLPVIFLSARVDEAHVHRGRELGCTYLTKPYVASALNSAIDSLLAAVPVAVLADW